MIKIIKFRGLDYLGEWVYGIPITSSTLHLTLDCIAQYYSDQRKYGRQNVMVSPETIGEFTGKLDQYDKEIYVGDIISDRPSGKYLCEVIFDFDLLAYATKNLKTGEISYLSEFTYAYIVGNIHKKSE